MQSFKLFLTGLFLFVPALVFAGNLDSPEALDNAGSAMYTVDDIYNRLNAGTAGTKRTTVFTEPAAGPGSTMHTLNDIMAMTPEVADTTGAVAAGVLNGKTFWGLTSGAWGLLTGTMPINTLDANNDTVTAGYYEATTLSAVDSDLAAGNVKDGVNIFGIAGTYTGGGGGGGSSAPVAKTGQNATVPFSAPDGSDGKLQKGVAWPNPRFTDNSDGTVTDNLTGLIWLKNAYCFLEKNWESALTSCNSLKHGDYSLTDGSSPGDWRLPNVKELQSLIDFAYMSPALSNTVGTGKWSNNDPFVNVLDAPKYWSSTTRTRTNDNTKAWRVNLTDGSVDTYNKEWSSCVWPVRGGQ